MAKQSEKTLQSAIDELRRIYDALNHSYDQVKIKILTFLGAGLAVLSFLYAGGDLFLPVENYGRIFYGVGLAMAVAGLVLLFIALRAATWFYPTENRDLANMEFATHNAFLEYCKKEYLDTIEKNLKTYEAKQKLLNTGLYLLTVGSIILVLLNQFGG